MTLTYEDAIAQHNASCDRQRKLEEERNLAALGRAKEAKEAEDTARSAALRTHTEEMEFIRSASAKLHASVSTEHKPEP